MITISELKGWQTTSEVHDSVSRGEGLPRGKSRFILLKLIRSFDDYDPKGCRGERKAPCLRRCTTKFVLGNPLRVIDAPTTARAVGLPPRGGQYFLSKRKKVPKKAGGTATLAARPAARNSQISAFRALPCPALVFAQACQSPTAFGSCAHWAHAPSRPKLRSAVAERLDDPNKFGSSNSGLRAGTV